jgi:MoxR-like ATPase
MVVTMTNNPRATEGQKAPPAAPGGPPGVFRRLGLYGLEGIAPVLLAALATEEPLLLIGPHGTAKSLLLTRIAAALGLEFRHYNASLLSFDDLVGFPLPGKDRRLEYVTTPAAVWGAGAVIFDEISRCRPEVQNKLFPIIHERKVQA